MQRNNYFFGFMKEKEFALQPRRVAGRKSNCALLRPFTFIGCSPAEPTILKVVAKVQKVFDISKYFRHLRGLYRQKTGEDGKKKPLTFAGERYERKVSNKNFYITK